MPETNEKPTQQNLWSRIAARAKAGKNVVLSPSTALMLIGELMAVRREAYHHDFPIVLEIWSADDSRIEEVILQSKHQDAAMAAFNLIVERRPNERVFLRKRAHVIGKHEPDPGK